MTHTLQNALDCLLWSNLVGKAPEYRIAADSNKFLAGVFWING